MQPRAREGGRAGARAPGAKRRARCGEGAERAHAILEEVAPLEQAALDDARGVLLDLGRHRAQPHVLVVVAHHRVGERPHVKDLHVGLVGDLRRGEGACTRAGWVVGQR